MECQFDWVAIEPGPVEAGGRTRVHEVDDSRTVLLASTGLSLAEATKSNRYDTILVDLPRLQDPREGLRDLKDWLHTFRSFERFAEERLSPDGVLIVIVPDAALPWLAAATQFHMCDLIVWQKKYAPQNDAKSLLAPMHDFVVVLSRSSPESMRPTFLHWAIGGKTEDATRQHAEYCASLKRTATPPARLKPRALWEWMATNIAKSSRSVLDLTASGFGICDHLPATVQRTDVVWDSDPDRSEILHLLNASQAGSDERHKPRSAGRVCGCAVPESEEPSPLTQERSSVLERVSGAGPIDQVEISTGAHDPVAVATHWLRGTVDLVTTSADYAAHAGGLLTSDGVVMVALGDRTHESLLLAMRTVPLAPVGHIVFFESEDSRTCSIWLAMVPWAQSASRQRGRSVEREWSNPDSDPRGNWRDPGHKGAKGGDKSLSYSLRVPPYRWGVVGGELPPGMWRLNETTGVIWGVPTVPGTWTLRVTVSDQVGKTSTATISIAVDDNTEMPQRPALSWLNESPKSSERLRVGRSEFSIPLGEEVAIELEARGGTPFTETVEPPGRKVGSKRSRYWEFSLKTLRSALAEDRVIWPVERRATKPRIKKFEREAKERPTALRSCISRQTGSSREDGVELRELVAFERCVNIEDGCASIFSTQLPNGSHSTYKVVDCAKCASLAEGTACTPEHSVQLVGYLLDPDRSLTPSPPEWLSEFAPTPATDLLNQSEAVVVTRGVLSDGVVSAIRAWRPGATKILFSRSVPQLVSAREVQKIPEFQWTE